MYKLRKIILSQDCYRLFELINLHSGEKLFPHQRCFICFDEFQHWIMEQLVGFYHDFFVIEQITDTNKIIVQGFILSYDYRTYDAHCQIYGYLSEGINGTILGQFTDFLFKEYPLKKVFLQLTDIDKDFLDSAFTLGFTQEAVLVENRYVNGKYHDLIILSLYSKGRG